MNCKTTILKKTLFVILTVFFIYPIALASDNEEIYTNTDYGFSINIPKGWSIDQSGPAPIITFRKTEQTPSAADVYLRIMSYPLDHKFKDQSPVDMLTEVTSSIQLPYVEEPRAFEQNGLKGARCIQDSVPVRGLTIIFIGRGITYTIQFTAPIENFEQEYKKIVNSLKSFKIIDEISAAYSQSCSIEENESFVQASFRAISTAMFTYVWANKGAYPGKIEDLLNADPPYLQQDFVSQKHGYIYSTQFYSDGFKITAMPVDCGITGNNTYVMESRGDEIKKMLQPGSEQREFKILKSNCK